MANKFCTDCGAEASPEIKFCGTCGKQIAIDQVNEIVIDQLEENKSVVIDNVDSKPWHRRGWSDWDTAGKSTFVVLLILAISGLLRSPLSDAIKGFQNSYYSDSTTVREVKGPSHFSTIDGFNDWSAGWQEGAIAPMTMIANQQLNDDPKSIIQFCNKSIYFNLSSTYLKHVFWSEARKSGFYFGCIPPDPDGSATDSNGNKTSTSLEGIECENPDEIRTIGTVTYKCIGHGAFYWRVIES